MPLAFSTCVLLISFIQLVNGAQFLKITFFISIICSSTVGSSVINSNSSFNNNICIAVITQTRF